MMAVKLGEPDSRRVYRETDYRYNGRPVMMMVEADGRFVRFRLKGRRKWYTTTVQAMFYVAVQATAEAEKAEKKRLREERRKAKAV